MRVQTKLISLLLLIAATFIAGIYLYRIFENKRMYAMFMENNEEISSYFDKLIKLKGASLETIAIDYTYWDEMVDFIRNNDIAWAKKMMDENVLKTYQADAIWIYKTDLSPVYSITSQDASGIKEFPMPIEAINNIFLKERLRHFFVNTETDLMEIRAATVHPTSDAERKTPAQGYFFTGRLWNKGYIDELAELAGGEAKISTTKQAIPSFEILSKTNAIIFSRELVDWKGKPAAYINVRVQAKELESYKLFARNAAMLFIGFIVCVMIFITIFLTISVSAPLIMISQALKTGKPPDPRLLEKDASEFGDIARLISRFFQQREELVKEMAERKKAETRFQQVADVTEEWIWEVDKDGLYTYSSPVVEKLLGYKAEEIIGKKHFYDFFTPETKEDLKKRAFEVFATQKTFRNFLNPNLHKNGSIILLETDGSPVLDKRGNLLGYRGVDTDVTERKKAEENLLHAAEEWKTTFDSIFDTISIHDKNYRIVRANKSFADTLKMKPQDVVGKTCYELIHGTSEPPSYCPHRRTLERKNPEKSEYFEPHLNMYLEVSTSPLFDEKGEIFGSVHIARDITFRKSLDKTRRLTELGKLVSDMAHEVNNPLMVISGSAQLSLLKETSDAEIKNNLEIIHEECNRAKDIIHRLLKFSKPSKGERKETDINQNIEAVVTLLEHQFSLANIKIQKKLTENLPLIPIYEKQIQEVFMNLLSNARDAMPEGGNIDITSSLEKEFIKIDIKDSGIGMNEENLSKIFEPFFTTKEKGTGLGLSVCYGIVKAHNGELKFQSQPGKGTTASLYLPLKRGGDTNA